MHPAATSDVLTFLDHLLISYYPNACLTLTAMHPDGKHPTPSRHIPLDRPDLLTDALTALLTANQRGWGAYVAVGWRRANLGRWRRGGLADVVALPALFADIDDPYADLTIPAGIPTPSCTIFSGHGYHLYWRLAQPTTDLPQCRRILRHLAQRLKGDHLSPAQSMRLPFTWNTKYQPSVLSRIIHMNSLFYTLDDFVLPDVRVSKRQTSIPRLTGGVDPVHIREVADHFRAIGYVERGEWLNGRCIYPQRHTNGDAHPSFGFNTRSGYGYCHRCGSILLKDICAEIGIQPADYGGIYDSNSDANFSKNSC